LFSVASRVKYVLYRPQNDEPCRTKACEGKVKFDNNHIMQINYVIMFKLLSCADTYFYARFTHAVGSHIIEQRKAL